MTLQMATSHYSQYQLDVNFDKRQTCLNHVTGVVTSYENLKSISKLGSTYKYLTRVKIINVLYFNLINNIDLHDLANGDLALFTISG